MAQKNGNATATSTAAPATGSEREKKAFVQYVKADGTVVNFPDPMANVVMTTFANGVTRHINIADLNGDIQHNATLQGVAIRTQRSYQAKKNIDEVIEEYDACVADLMNGVWIEGGKGEARVTMLARAIVLSLEADGANVDAAREKGIIEKLKSSEFRDKAMANEHVKVHLANLKLEAAKERAAEAKKAFKELPSKTSAKESLSDF